MLSPIGPLVCLGAGCVACAVALHKACSDWHASRAVAIEARRAADERRLGIELEIVRARAEEAQAQARLAEAQLKIGPAVRWWLRVRLRRRTRWWRVKPREEQQRRCRREGRRRRAGFGQLDEEQSRTGGEEEFAGREANKEAVDETSRTLDKGQ